MTVHTALWVDMQNGQINKKEVNLTEAEEENLEYLHMVINLVEPSGDRGFLIMDRYEGFLPEFRYQGSDKEKMMRRIEIIKTCLDRFAKDNS